MQLSEKYMIYKQRVRDGQMGITPQLLDDIPGSYGEDAGISSKSCGFHTAVQKSNYDGRMCAWGVLLTPLLFR